MGFVNYSGGRYVLQRGSSASVRVGPFVSISDGYTPLTDMTIANGEIGLSKNDGAFAIRNSGVTPTHDSSGWYVFDLNTNDINTQGNLTMRVHAAGALPVWRRFEVDDTVPGPA